MQNKYNISLKIFAGIFVLGILSVMAAKYFDLSQGAMVFLGLIIILLIGFAYFQIQKSKIEDFKKNGLKLLAVVKYIKFSVYYAGAGGAGLQKVYEICCEVNNPNKDGSTSQELMSQKLLFEPQIKAGDLLDVYFNKGNYNDYYLDINKVKLNDRNPSSSWPEIGLYISTDGINYKKQEEMKIDISRQNR